MCFEDCWPWETNEITVVGKKLVLFQDDSEIETSPDEVELADSRDDRFFAYQDLRGESLKFEKHHDGIWLFADLSGTDVAWCELQFGRFLRSRAIRATFYSCNLRYANIDWASWRQVDLSWSVLDGASAVRADLSGANFAHVNMRDADLSEARLEGCVFHCTDLRGTKLNGATIDDGLGNIMVLGE